MISFWFSFLDLIKLLVVGASGVGKTQMVLRFAEDKFQEEFLPTIGVEFKIRNLEVDTTRVKAQIWDVSGKFTFLAYIK